MKNDLKLGDKDFASVDGDAITFSSNVFSLSDIDAAIKLLEPFRVNLITQPVAGLAGLAVAASPALSLMPDEKHSLTDYTINDAIKLVVRDGSQDAASSARFLQRWGSWWRVKAAIHSKNRDKSWLLSSIAIQPREIKRKEIIEIIISKTLDPRYAVIAYLKFPMDFTYTVAELHARTQVS